MGAAQEAKLTRGPELLLKHVVHTLHGAHRLPPAGRALVLSAAAGTARAECLVAGIGLAGTKKGQGAYGF